MAKRIEKLLEQYQGNAYPAMLAELGNHLGVSEDSLRRIALGWAPIVEFKKGKNFSGWWVIAERDADGVPIGLSLRSQNDMKVMFPGSKHGLIFEVNPNHEQGGGGYNAGPDNWIRTMNAGVLCPVCQKPDGCLISAENPADPKAAVCIREKDGATKPMKFGYLHILKAEGNLVKGASALAGDPKDYVIVVEGMTDAAAAMDMGFPSVGRPSNLACMSMLRDLLHGRKVIIVGENDKKSDGKEPGKDGMIATFQTLSKCCHDIRMLMPPEGVKDLRAWKVNLGLTREDFLAYAEEHGQKKVDASVLSDDRPLTIARAYLDDQHRMAGRYTVKRWNGSWFKYAGAKYVELRDEEFESPLYPWSHDRQVQYENHKGEVSIKPLRADNGLIQNVTNAIVSETLVGNLQIPCWVNGKQGPDPRDLIVFNNGILHVPSFLEGASEKDYLLDLTPDLFTTAALPFAFDPTAQCPTWKKFLRTSLGDEQEKIMLLREWFGYCMTPDTSMQKLMFLRGPTGSGKGTVLRVLCKLVGDEQSSSTSFADLCGPFGVQSLFGKLICVIPDARTPKNRDIMRGLELLLNIAGNDPIQINRKFKDPLASHQLFTRITIASNGFLEVPDDSGAMLRRLAVIEFKNSFVGREDRKLDEKLTDEIQGIAVWALTGLRRLREQQRFTIPQSGSEALGEWRVITSPMASFIEECCDPIPGVEMLKTELYDAWTAWSKERHLSPMSRGQFLERMRANAPFASSDTYVKGGHKLSVFRGITLKKWAAKQYLGRP